MEPSEQDTTSDRGDAPAADTARTEQRFILQTQITDTPDNRAVIAVCERYRVALEARDKSALLALASRDYLDDAGTPDASDDVDHQGLAASLDELLPMISDVHYVFDYQRILWRGSRALIDYHYAGAYRARGIERQIADVNQLELVRDGATFKIVAGM